MYNNVRKAYLNINNYIKNDEPKVGKTSGLLGRGSTSRSMETPAREPIDRMAKLVDNIRKARLEIRNASTRSED